MQGVFMIQTNNVGLYNLMLDEDCTKQNNMWQKTLIGNDFYIKWNVINKFTNDKIMIENEEMIVCFDGVILNLKEILQFYEKKTLHELLVFFISNNLLKEILSKFRGSFCGFIYDKKNKKVSVFTDQLSTRQLFYYMTNEIIIISSEVKTIVNFFRINNMKYCLDYVGAYSLISYGYMLEEYTLIKNIKRVLPGSIFHIKEKKIDIEKYYSICNRELDISENEAIERLDILFENAVRLQLDKNEEYGYCDYAPLSAGMDCRMTSFMIKRIKDTPITNFTYSEYGEYDCVEAGKMSKFLGNRWFFKNLDNGLDLFDIEKSIELSDGLIYYFWASQLNDFMKEMDTTNWGIVHTGVLGDVIVGSYKKDNRYCRDYEIGDGAFSKKCINKLIKYFKYSDHINDITEDYEIAMLKNRGINGICLGYTTTFSHYTENLSPFMNVDFFDFCLSLPLKYRYNHNIYYKWIEKKFPEVAQFKHNGVTIKGNAKLKLNGRYYRVRAIPDLVRNIVLQRYKKGYGMNPIQLWMDSNYKLSLFIDKYYKNNISILSPWQELQNDVCRLYNTGTAQEKIMALSLIGSVKMMFY